MSAVNKIDCMVSNDVNNGENKILLQTASVKFVDESFNEEDNLKGLLTYADEDGLNRLKPKIIRIYDTEDLRCPIVLPLNEELVHRLIFDQSLPCRNGPKF
ncbi:hypothetical protein NPIL_646971 [Nephila pilipes]|uniref:Uncharacterized protein n=1 Tax=Nephila pilipes TaxID=299642 RepID=A0A8X6U4B3_NEPPI|nr:hypothetical protein NPIL_646971 [Nephila pilipes]